MAASMFMNSNSLPIALMQSLVVTVPGLKWDDDDNKNVMLGRALTYLVLYSTLGMVVRWSYGVRLLSQADPEGSETGDEHPRPITQGHERDSSDATLHSSYATLDAPAPHIAVHGPNLQVNRPHVFYSFPNTPAASTVRLNQDDNTNATTPAVSDYESDPEDGELPIRRPIAQPTTSKFKSSIRRTKRRIGNAIKTVNDFMTVPLWASLASLVVACVQPLQHALEYHMQPLKGALASAGHCSIPLTLVVLGAYFYSPSSKGDEERNADQSRTRERSVSTATTSHLSLVGSVRSMFKMSSRRSRAMSSSTPPKDKRPGETKTVIIAVLSRMVITPLLLLPLMAFCAKYDWHHVFSEYVFRLRLFLDN